MGKLTALLQHQYPDQFEGPVTSKAIAVKLNLLKARLYMIKEGVQAGLNQRQLIALDLPPLTKEVEEMYRIFQPEQKWPNWEEDPPTGSHWQLGMICLGDIWQEKDFKRLGTKRLIRKLPPWILIPL